MIKSLPANVEDVRDTGLIPGLGRSPRVGNGNPLQYSCLENPTDRGAWWATVHGGHKESETEHTHTHIHINVVILSNTLYCLIKTKFFFSKR